MSRTGPLALPVPTVDRQEVVDLTAALIRIPTVPSLNPRGESEAMTLIARVLGAAGAEYRFVEVSPGRSNLVVEMGDPGGRTLWLNGHLDTVPIGNRLTWQHEPFGGDVVGDRLYGRGASDCKGGVAAMIGAALALRRGGVSLAGQLRVSVVVGEEEGQVGITHLLDQGFEADAFVSAQWSTARQIALGYRGLCWVEVWVHGRSAHGSRPSQGVNAIEQMVDLVLPALRGLELGGRAARPMDGLGPSVNLGQLEGGDAVNLVPDRCRATLDYRLVSGQRSDDVVQAIDTRLKALQARHPQLNVEFQVMLQAEPFVTDPDSDLVRGLARAVEAVTGEKPRLFGKSGTSDANLVCRRLGIPVVAYGPGNDSGHNPDEFVHVPDLGEVAQAYAQFAMDYLGTHAPAAGGDR